MSEELKRQTCKECGSTDDVIDELCEKCEEGKVYCRVCDEWQDRDGETCRHLFWSDCGESGSGSWDWDYCREPFFAFLDLLSMIPPESTRDRSGWLGWRQGDRVTRDLVSEMERWLLEDNFWTFTHGCLLSTPDIDFRHQRRDDWCPPFATVRAEWAQHWSEEFPEKMNDAQDGFGWLQTLQAEKTKQANARTVRWIGEWRMGKRRTKLGA